jgi:hypothetical protein
MAARDFIDDMGLKQELQLQMKKRLELEDKNTELEKRVAELEAKLEKLLEGKPARVKLTPEEKKQANLITSKLYGAREALMAGRLTDAIFEVLRTYCDTTKRQEALVQAYHGYCNHHKAESWEEMSYEEALEELEKELAAKKEGV